MSLKATRDPVEVEWGYDYVVDQAWKEGLGVPQCVGFMISSDSLEVCFWSVNYKDSRGSIYLLTISKLV